MRKYLVGSGLVGLLVVLSACGGGGGSTIGSIVISADITANDSWSPNAADCDYTIDTGKEIQVKAKLVVQAGTKVCFSANSGLVVTETGSLTAVGTNTNRITFTGTVAAKGQWKGLAFRSNDPANELSFADILYGGNDDNFCCDYFEGPNISAALLVGSNSAANASLKLANSKVALSGNFGLYVFNAGRLNGFSSNTFSDNTKAPVAVPMIEIGKLDSASNYSGTGGTANAVNAIQVNETPEANSNVNQTILKLDVPYGMMLGDPNTSQNYKGNLVVQAGVRFEFESNSGLQILETGSLNAVGTLTSPIVFTGRIATKGYWKGIAFRSNTATNRLERTEVSYAGNNENFCCDYFEGPNISAAILVGSVFVKNAKLALVNSTVRESDNYGAYQFGGGNAITASGNTYTNNDLGNNPTALP